MRLSDSDDGFRMNSYKSLHLRDRLISWSLTKKRLFIILAIFIVFSVALLAKAAPRRMRSAYIDDESYGRPGVAYAPEDEWKPPLEWDPVLPVYTNFTRLEDRFSGTIRRLTTTKNKSTAPVSKQYHPYPKYESEEYRRRYQGTYTPCVGPRGKRLNESSEDFVSGYNGMPQSFPDAPLGSSREVGLEQGICFERHGRYGAFGSGISGDRPDKKSSKPSDVDWGKVDWATLQSQCVDENADRFNMWARPMPGDPKYEHLNDNSPTVHFGTRPKTRSAIIFRSFDGFKYTSDTLRVMRSVITELSLGSGGEYQAFLLVQVKDTTIPIFDDQDAYEKILLESVPMEFRNMTVLWNTALWGELYPRLPEGTRNVHASQWLPVQYFALKHPEFDHYWNWEMDVRYTGHHYELLESLGTWTKKQPRKGLWERNSRFYVPGFHGDYATEFTDYIQGKYLQGPEGRREDLSIWGPDPPPGQAITPLDDLPPLQAPTPIHDNFEWGVGEDADLITLLPMFNPDTTHYALRAGYYNYPQSLLPQGPPRRATIITFYRLSHRLLSTMHLENTRSPGHHMSSEQWPQSVALHHGFKAVYAPHSVYIDRQWPAQATNFIFNNGDSRRVIKAFKDMAALGEGSGGWESVFGMDREHSFVPSTFYYRTDFATRLYKRLLGYEIDGIGGEVWEKEHGTFCLPPMLLHQIKDMDDPSTVLEHDQAGTDAQAQENAFQEEKAQGNKQALQAATNGATEMAKDDGIDNQNNAGKKTIP